MRIAHRVIALRTTIVTDDKLMMTTGLGARGE